MFVRIFVNGFPVDKAIASLSSFLCIIEYIRFRQFENLIERTTITRERRIRMPVN